MSGLRQSQFASEGWQDVVTALAERPPEAHLERPESPDRQGRLTRTIESEIIPRLLLAHARGRAAAPPPTQSSLPGADDVENFARILVAHDLATAHLFVDALSARGMALETIFLELFAPSARHLDELWKADLCDFVDVTMALSRLQQLLRDLSPIFAREAEYPERGRRVLLVPMPGEQHTFGLSLVEEFFRRAGWEVWVEGPATADELTEFLRGMWFGVIGVSVSGDRCLSHLAPAIRSIRRESLNRAIGVMVGGRPFLDNPDLVTDVGADASATDARGAVEQAQRLIGLIGTRY